MKAIQPEPGCCRAEEQVGGVIEEDFGQRLGGRPLRGLRVLAVFEFRSARDGSHRCFRGLGGAVAASFDRSARDQHVGQVRQLRHAFFEGSRVELAQPLQRLDDRVRPRQRGTPGFGFGWSLSLPAITRKTDKGVCPGIGTPKSRTCSFSPAPKTWCPFWPDGTRFEDDTTAPGYSSSTATARASRGFCPHRALDADDGDVHWRSISKDNILTLYGKDSKSRIADPEDRTHLQLADLRDA